MAFLERSIWRSMALATASWRPLPAPRRSLELVVKALEICLGPPVVPFYPPRFLPTKIDKEETNWYSYSKLSTGEARCCWVFGRRMNDGIRAFAEMNSCCFMFPCWFLF